MLGKDYKTLFWIKLVIGVVVGRIIVGHSVILALWRWVEIHCHGQPNKILLHKNKHDF